MTDETGVQAVWKRLKTLLLKSTFALAIFGILPQEDGAALAHSSRPAIDRVDEIRDKLLRSDRLQAERVETRDGRERVVQWYNFPNWPNWRNWRNW